MFQIPASRIIHFIFFIIIQPFYIKDFKNFHAFNVIIFPKHFYKILRYSNYYSTASKRECTLIATNIYHPVSYAMMFRFGGKKWWYKIIILRENQLSYRQLQRIFYILFGIRIKSNLLNRSKLRIYGNQFLTRMSISK